MDGSIGMKFIVLHVMLICLRGDVGYSVASQSVVLNLEAR